MQMPDNSTVLDLPNVPADCAKILCSRLANRHDDLLPDTPKRFRLVWETAYSIPGRQLLNDRLLSFFLLAVVETQQNIFPDRGLTQSNILAYRRQIFPRIFPQVWQHYGDGRIAAAIRFSAKPAYYIGLLWCAHNKSNIIPPMPEALHNQFNLASLLFHKHQGFLLLCHFKLQSLFMPLSLSFPIPPHKDTSPLRTGRPGWET